MKMHRLVCDRMFEIELISTQSDCLPSFIAGKLRVIFCISDDRASNGGKLHTDLVMTSGVQMNLKFGLVTFLTLRRQISTEEELPETVENNRLWSGTVS